MIQRLTEEQVLGVNVELCTATGENSACLDRDGLLAALARPFSGFGDREFYATVWDKTAALLHGIASRQVFENGNKRTAWSCAVIFLDLNGIDLGYVPTVHANMFVRAVGLDHSLEIADVAEWFEVTYGLGRPEPS